MKNRNLEHKDHWETPSELLYNLYKEFGNMFDPCPINHDINKWDGLKIDWDKRNFINPPYSRKLKEAFILKAFEESKKGKLCVMLLPVSTSTKIFHKIILPNAEIRFVKGRIAFKGINTFGKKVGKGSAPMHDSMIVIFGNGQIDKESIRKVREQMINKEIDNCATGFFEYAGVNYELLLKLKKGETEL